MTYTKETVLTKVNIAVMARFLVLSSAATILPFYIHTQWITGPLINAILILTLMSVGIRSALIVCLIPSLIAMSSGLLPAILAPIVPFIMIANTILVLTIDWFDRCVKDKTKAYWSGLFIGASLKFFFLYISVSFISKLLIKQELAVKVARMMSWPQFATAVIGGIIAWIILNNKFTNKKFFNVQ
ncbi:iron hydrogenase [Candidatus Parcubacteria bacterium]|nr:iron hydrogenase [Candidatus Parcubacteria bacterium]